MNDAEDGKSYWDLDGQLMVLEREDSKRALDDLEHTPIQSLGKRVGIRGRVREILPSPGGDFAFLEIAGLGRKLMSLSSVCVNATPVFEAPDENCCENRQLSGQEIKLPLPEEWTQARSGISKTHALNHLRSWVEREDFDPAQDLPVLLGILDSSLSVQNPDLIWNMAVQLLEKQPNLFWDLEASWEKLPVPNLNLKFDIKDKDRLFNAVKKSILLKLRDYGKKIRFKDLKFLKVLTPTIQQLSEAQKTALSDIVEERLSQAVLDSEGGNDLFPSAVRYLVGNAIAPYFALSKHRATQLTWNRKAATLEPIVLSSDVINRDYNTVKDDFGFAIQRRAPIHLVEVSKKPGATENLKIDWEMGDQASSEKFSGTLQIKVGQIQDNIKTTAKPNYEGHLSDQKMRGLIVIALNMGPDVGAQLLGEYQKYFRQNRGFVFDPFPKEISDFQKYFNQNISANDLDFLVKEAHSDGDEQNLFRMTKRALVYHAERKKQGNQPAEEVDIVMPFGEGETILLRNSEFGQSVQSRSSPLVYFNTSCWSWKKAIHELNAAKQSSHLTVIPTTTLTYGFSAQPDNAEFLLFEGFLNRKTYSEMREALKANPEYKSSRENQFIFPDESRYIDHIFATTKIPAEVTISVTDQNGKPYEWDQRIHGR